MKEIAHQAFARVTPEMVRNCYDHVEEQEAKYRLLHNIPDLNVEEIEEETVQSEPVLPIVEEGAIVFNENGQALIPVDADIEVIETEVMPEIYSCSLCNYQTQNITYWNKHVKSVYECDNCGDTFHGHNSKRNLAFHLKTHQPKTPKPQKVKTVKPKQPRKIKPKVSHKCSQCEKSFPYLSYLNRHRKNIHGLNIERKKDLRIEKESSPLPEKHLM